MRLLAMICMVSVLSGCASTAVLKTWKDESQSRSFSKIVVLGVFQEPAFRNLVEKELVNRLNTAGVDALASVDSLPASVLQEEATAMNAVRDIGADGVLVVRVVNTQQETVYTPGTMFVTGGYGGRYTRGWYGYFNRGYQVTTSPGFSTQYLISTVETAVFDSSSNNRIWSTITETTETSPTAAISSYLKAITPPLLDSGLF